MTVQIFSNGKRVATQKPFKKRKRQGFSNRLALYLIWFLLAALVMGFILAWRSITTGYMGALACFSCCVAPIGTVASAAIGKIVDKNKAENTQGGIKYATAESKGFVEDSDSCVSPPI